MTLKNIWLFIDKNSLLIMKNIVTLQTYELHVKNIFVNNDIERKKIICELEKKQLLLKAIKLLLNVIKTQFMFSINRKLYVTLICQIKNAVINNVSKFIYLGILTDERLH